MISNIYHKPDNHREALTGTIQIVAFDTESYQSESSPVLVGVHGSARVVLIGENPFTQPTLTALVGKRIKVYGIWKRGALHFWDDNWSEVEHETTIEDETPTEQQVTAVRRSVDDVESLENKVIEGHFPANDTEISALKKSAFTICCPI